MKTILPKMSDEAHFNRKVSQFRSRSVREEPKKLNLIKHQAASVATIDKEQTEDPYDILQP